MNARFWAIADTHLSFSKSKTMDRFGGQWENHTERMAAAWRASIAPDDFVLLPGDVSWAQSTRHILPDLAWLSGLPGRKILLRGNHDHWWKDVYAARQIAEPLGFHLVEGDSITFEEAIVCGAMGHIAPNDPYFDHDARKDRFGRELKRLTNALDNAMAGRKPGQPVVLMMHYPPFTSQGKRTEFIDAISHYQPTICLYGHFHHKHEWEITWQGHHEGVHYMFVAADYLGMTPRQVWPLPECPD